MKKITLLLLIILFSNGLQTFASSFFPPEWNEFCPAQYIYLHPEKRYFLKDKIYWQQRRINFDKKVNYCNKLTDKEKTNCYQEIRLMEKNATEVQMKQDENDNIKTLQTYRRY